MAQNTTKMIQFRFYEDDNENNQPYQIMNNTLGDNTIIKHTFYCNPTFFGQYAPIVQLGIQTVPGTKFYLNGSADPVVVGPTGIYQLDLTNTSAILNSLRVDQSSMEIINNLPNGYLIIDLVYTGGNN